MTGRRWGLVLGAALLGGCAHPIERAQAPDYSQHVDNHLLSSVPDGPHDAVPSYTLDSYSAFRMPVAEQSPQPLMPDAFANRELPPTQVCARVAISADGAVMSVSNLVDRDECRAGEDPANTALVTSMLAALHEWRFAPAAMCTYPDDVSPPADPGDCAAAQKIVPVPVTLEFAFTFAVHEGHAQVHAAQAPR